jgi:hypothetical protein
MSSKGTYKQYVQRHKDSSAKGGAMSKGAWEAYHDSPHPPGHGRKQSMQHADNLETKGRKTLMESYAHNHDAAQHPKGSPLHKAHLNVAKAHGESYDHHKDAKNAAYEVHDHQGNHGQSDGFQEHHDKCVDSRFRSIGGGDRNKGMHMFKNMKVSEQDAHNRAHSHAAHAGNRHPLHPAHPHPKVHGVMEKLKLHEEDADDTKKFRHKMDKAKGQMKGPAWLKAEFLKHCKPETKKRMEGMSTADFMVMFNAIKDDEEDGGGKQASKSMTSDELEKWLRDIKRGDTIDVYWDGFKGKGKVVKVNPKSVTVTLLETVKNPGGSDWEKGRKINAPTDAGVGKWKDWKNMAAPTGLSRIKKGRAVTLRTQVINLAHTNPTLREKLLEVVR